MRGSEGAAERARSFSAERAKKPFHPISRATPPDRGDGRDLSGNGCGGYSPFASELSLETYWRAKRITIQATMAATEAKRRPG